MWSTRTLLNPVSPYWFLDGEQVSAGGAFAIADRIYYGDLIDASSRVFLGRQHFMVRLDSVVGLHPVVRQHLLVGQYSLVGFHYVVRLDPLERLDSVE